MPAAPRAWIAGRDESRGIVSVSADTSGLARVWRRTPGGGLAATDHRFPNWFLATDLELVGHMTVRQLAPAALGGDGDRLADVGALGVVELEDEPVDDAYRFLVLTERLAEVEAAILETYNKRVSGQLQSLAELRGLVLVLPPVEQFLVLTGRTYFKGLAYDDLVRLQFDLETTGLDEQRDRIFMISMRDNRGWRTCLDISAMSEQALLGRLRRAHPRARSGCAREPQYLRLRSPVSGEARGQPGRPPRAGTRWVGTPAARRRLPRQ